MVRSGYKTELTVPMLEKADRVVMSGNLDTFPEDVGAREKRCSVYNSIQCE